MVGAGWNAERHVHDHPAAERLLRRLLRVDHADAGAIARRRAVGRVVHLQDDLGVRRQPARHARLVGFTRHVRRDAAKPDAARRPLVVRRAARGLRVRDDVVDDRRIARTELDRLNPLVLGQMRRHADVLIGDRAIGRDLELLGHREDRVGLADRPALGERRPGRQIAVVAARRARVDPGGNRVDVLLREARIVLEDAVRRVGRPRRHLALHHALLDGARPGTGLFVCHQRHRREHRRPMAADAVVVDNRRDVLGIGHRALGGSYRRLGQEQPEGASRDETLHGVLHKCPPRK